MTQNMALLLKGIKDLTLDEVPTPDDLKPDEVLLKVNYCGICGTDMHVYQDGYFGSMGNMLLSKPLILGHEMSGTVVKVGNDVKHLNVGDRVAAEPSIPCRNCELCLSGNYNLCELSNKTSKGKPPNDGFMQRFAKHSALFCYRVPDSINQKEAALTEPLSCALSGVQKTGIKFGDKVLIVGAGPIGLLSLLGAKAYGAAKICVIDTNRERLEVAERLGADCSLVVNKNDTPQQLATSIEQCIGRVDVTLECTGTQSGTHSAILASKFGAKIALVGVGPHLITIPACELLFREIHMIGVNKFANNMKLALHLMETGKIDVKPLISHIFPLEKWSSAFETVEKQKGLKVLIEC